MFIISHAGLKGFEVKERIVQKGIYSKIRNPMYTGFAIWIVGLPLFMQKPLALLSSVIWTGHLVLWKVLEEKELEKKYPEYSEYKTSTWF
jgi:protein-S-isoprenylcysteine O-methyltransferase Ste14